jgi:hypothetical protein
MTVMEWATVASLATAARSALRPRSCRAGQVLRRLRREKAELGGLSGVRLRDVVPALVCGVYPHTHHRPRGGIAEPLVRRYPPGSWPGCLGVSAPSPDRTPACGSRRRELRKVRHRRGSLVHIPGTQHDAHPAIQLVIVKLPQRVVFAEQGDQLFAVGLTGQPPRTAGR